MFLISFALGFTFLTAPGHAAPSDAVGLSPGILHLTESGAPGPLGRSLAVLEDAGATLDLAAVRQREREFRPVLVDVPSPGFSRSAFWYRLHLVYEGPVTARRLLEIRRPLLDHVDLYVVADSVPIVHQAGGRAVPLSRRPYVHQNHVFPLDLEPGRLMTLYIRVASDDTVSLPAVLQSVDQLLAKDRVELYIYGLYFGMLLSVFLYNLFLYFSLKERAYFWYCLYILTLCVYQLNIIGLTGFVFFPEAPLTGKYWVILFSYVIMLSVAAFVRTFLELRSHYPGLHRVWNVALSLVCLMAGATCVWGYAATIQWQALLALLFILLTIASGLASLRAGFRPARLFLVAWFLPLLGMALFLLRNFGLFPAGPVANYGVLFGTALEAVLLSLALADRINGMKRSLETFAVRLEAQVRERTEELTRALEEIRTQSAEHRGELRVAAAIQTWFLGPRTLDLDVARLRTQHRYLDAVGGDFFDSFRFPDGALGVLLADASGHGVPAGFLTAMAKIAFYEAVRRAGDSPRAVLLQANHEMHHLMRAQDFLTATMAVFLPGRRVRYCAAAHPEAYWLRRAAGRVERLPSTGTLLGIGDNDDPLIQSLAEVEVQCAAGDRFLLYTDGFSDAQNARGERFADGVMESALTATSALDLDAAQSYLLGVLHEFLGGETLKDDSTFLLIEIP